MRKVSRASIKEKTYADMLLTEEHHDHEIIKDESGVLRWRETPGVKESLNNINLGSLWALLRAMGLTKNSEFVRKLYRDMGYSLHGYWEVFYWNVNNDDANKYVPKKSILKDFDGYLKVDPRVKAVVDTIDEIIDLCDDPKVKKVVPGVTNSDIMGH